MSITWDKTLGDFDSGQATDNLYFESNSQEGILPQDLFFGNLEQTIITYAYVGEDLVGSSVVSGLATITPTGLTDADGLGSSSVSALAAITPAGLTDADSFGSPSVGALAVITATELDDSSDSFGTNVISALAVITPAGLDDSDSFGDSVLTDTDTITAISLVNSGSFGTSHLDPNITIISTGGGRGVIQNFMFPVRKARAQSLYNMQVMIGGTLVSLIEIKARSPIKRSLNKQLAKAFSYIEQDVTSEPIMNDISSTNLHDISVEVFENLINYR